MGVCLGSFPAPTATFPPNRSCEGTRAEAPSHLRQGSVLPRYPRTAQCHLERIVPPAGRSTSPSLVPHAGTAEGSAAARGEGLEGLQKGLPEDEEPRALPGPLTWFAVLLWPLSPSQPLAPVSVPSALAGDAAKQRAEGTELPGWGGGLEVEMTHLNCFFLLLLF